MPGTKSSSSSPEAEGRLVRVALERVHPHPLNANAMGEEQLKKLARNIERQGSYPPLLVRPHPELEGEYQLLDGEQRWQVLRRLGHDQALCFIWPCDDGTALLLLSTLNRCVARTSRPGAPSCWPSCPPCSHPMSWPCSCPRTAPRSRTR
ncbi:MAG: hypothetical protein GEU28_08630 [Dehalococcoidia bacterium]|nr:hypothetical protein [Dehalococcoidia bacterium]